MATSGTYSFNPDNASIVEEAYSRIGILPESLTSEHLEQAITSMNYLMIDWENDWIRQYLIEETTFNMLANTATYTMPNEALSILTVVHRDANDLDIAIRSCSRQQYDFLYDKDQQSSKPDRYFFDKERASPTLSIWPAPNNSTTSLVVNYFRRHQDAGEPNENPDVHRRWLNALAAELAVYLAEKYNAQRVNLAKQRANEFLMRAKNAERENAPVRLKVRYGRRRY